jgi:hypothetical protein
MMEAALKGGESMSSLYDELAEKLRKDPRLTKRGGARFDLSLLLFNARDALRALWDAADIEVTRVWKPPSSSCVRYSVRGASRRSPSVGKSRTVPGFFYKENGDEEIYPYSIHSIRSMLWLRQ